MRRIGDSALAYIGQTAELRRRIGQLCVLYRDEMPYNDPHTAAPCLWVMRTADDAKFEFSIAEFAGDVRERKMAECVVAFAAPSAVRSLADGQLWTNAGRVGQVHR